MERDLEAIRGQGPGDAPPRLLNLPVIFTLVLYLLSTSRWGSYLTIPGAPFYISDLFVATAALQVTVLIRQRPIFLSSLARAPIVMQLVAVLVLYAGLRLVSGLEISVDVLRDFAPYGYAVAALIGFLLPIRNERRWRPVIYGGLLFHAGWVVLLPRVPGFPWALPTFGSDATLLVARPDFDTAVLGVGASLALFELLHHRGRRHLVIMAALMLFAAFSALGTTTLSTRAGTLAAVLALLSVIATWLASHVNRGAATPLGTLRRVKAALLLVLALTVLGSALVLTPAGDRLTQGLGSTSSEAYGTVKVRQDVWKQVNRYILNNAGRTAVGVGFGPNFIADSGSRAALEGSTYQNVRSPHNYVIGTFARLGTAGALLVLLIILLAGWLGISQLRCSCGPVTALASLLVLALPVVALLGVVLEAPFGAITYFWAVGQLSHSAVSAGRNAVETPESDDTEVPTRDDAA